MNPVIFLSIIVGFFTRIVDDYYDRKTRIPKPVVVSSAIVYGFLIAFIAKEIPVTMSLALAVIVGLVICRKIDYYGHMLGIITFFIATYFFSFGSIDVILFLSFVLAGIADEIVSDRFEKKKKLFYEILSHRPFLEITALLVSVCTGEWEIWLVLLLYDIGAGYIPVYKLLKTKN
ncbi:MAG: hypothetical protein V1900_04270 [Candidatus Aenigmatarchaeota archaeon]